MESVFNRFVINLFHAFDRKELAPTISIVAVDKEYVRTCSSAELEKLLTVAKGEFSTLVLLWACLRAVIALRAGTQVGLRL